MLDRAERGFAYPAINVTSSETLNAAIRGYAEAGSDGIVQISGEERVSWSNPRLKDMVMPVVAWPSSPSSQPGTRSTSPSTPTTAPRTSSTATCAR